MRAIDYLENRESLSFPLTSRRKLEIRRLGKSVLTAVDALGNSRDLNDRLGYARMRYEKKKKMPKMTIRKMPEILTFLEYSKLLQIAVFSIRLSMG